MSDIFISYASEDRAKAEVLAHALEEQGWSVWWDRTIPAGRTFDEVIEKAIDEAKCIIVLWSKAAVTSRWVRTEAEEGARRNILVPVLIEKVEIPLAFRRIQAADLSGWTADTSSAEFEKLVADISGILGPPASQNEKGRLRPADVEAQPDRPDAPKEQQAPAGLQKESTTAKGFEERGQAAAVLPSTSKATAGARFGLVAIVVIGAIGIFYNRCVPPPGTAEPGTVFRDKLKDGTEGPQMVVVRPGSVTMGSPDNEDGHHPNERPMQTVTLSKAFAIGPYELTVGEFRRFVEATQYRTEAEASEGCHTWTGDKWERHSGRNWRSPGFSQGDDHPVVCVSWNDAGRYLDWLSEQTGKRYRLPTEAEWEYAARAGTTTARYWGNDPHQACAYANVKDQTFRGQFSGATGVHECKDDQVYTAPGGSYQRNRYGLYDMLGNVLEWVEDCYHDSYEGLPPDGRGWVDTDCAQRVIRSGSWYGDPWGVRSAVRHRNTPADPSSEIGFRLAEDID